MWAYKAFRAVIKERFKRRGVRITRKIMDYKYESLQIRFPESDRSKAGPGRAWNSECAARIQIISTDSGYTYRIWMETPARELVLAYPGVYAELEGICDTVYKLATRENDK